jgi:hypothetical protein
MSLRTRATSFLAGFALAGGATFYQLHKDINTGTEYLAAQVGCRPYAAQARIAASGLVLALLSVACPAIKMQQHCMCTLVSIGPCLWQ